MLSLFKKKDRPTFQAFIQSMDKTVTVKHRQTLLEAALEAGLDYPFSCGAGSCTTCKTKLVQGEYKDLSDMSLVLSEDDLKKGYILACQAIPKTDLIVTLEPDESREYSGEITAYKKLTHDIIEIRVKLSEKMRYNAGQYADIFVGPIRGSRSYSFAAAPGAGGGSNEIAFHLRLVPNGEMTSWFHEKDRSGEKIKLRGPRGSFGWREEKSNWLCIAGGSGMAPMKAMLEDAVQKKSAKRIVYLFGARTQKDLYALDDMKRVKDSLGAKFDFLPVLSNEEESSSWKGARGFVTEAIAQQQLDFNDTAAFLCGPPPMIDAAIKTLNELGISNQNIFFDKFTDKSHVNH
ncbi:MAG: 2Fe-2S iron-sulfur cluster binding domain-containing protein [Spirochaetes bacterium]|nr:2Fe-2S iron-sulfur cluster binding domain-containing protein [Spirochaetota bacterium]